MKVVSAFPQVCNRPQKVPRTARQRGGKEEGRMAKVEEEDRGLRERLEGEGKLW